MCEINKIDLASADLVAERIEQIKALFPEAVVENAEGGGGSKLDFDRLRLLLGDEVDEGDERYSFTWPGKADAIRLSQTVSTATLRPCPEQSVNWDTTENLYIEGDNLEVLKLLQRAYHGKVKLIYIDPPYNTGNDFIYHDSFDNTLDNYLQQTKQVNQSHPERDGRFHSSWCSMIYPRLRLARELLSNDGVIFISIDDNEQGNLKNICNEVFGQNNFIAQVVWQRAYAPVNLKKHFSECHDYILCFAKDIEHAVCRGLPKTTEAEGRYKNPDNDPRGPWKAADSTVGPAVPERVYPLTLPSGRVVTPSSGRCWLYSKEKFKELIDDRRVWFGPSGDNVPAIKKFASEVKQTMTPMTIWGYKEVGHSQDASKALMKIFDGKAVFDYPKPVGLVKRCLQLYSDPDSIVMDFFSGSGVLAEATMELNADDGGSRRFLCVQLPEKTASKSKARTSGYKTLTDIGEERIRCVGDKLQHARADNNQLSPDKKMSDTIDTGFRVLSLDESGFAKPQPGQLLIDRIKPGRSDLDIIFEMMLKWGLELTYPVEEDEIEGYPIYSVACDELICCMRPGLTVDVLEAIAARQPRRVFLLDSVIDDTIKLNALQIFKRVEERTQQKIDLRTV